MLRDHKTTHTVPDESDAAQDVNLVLRSHWWRKWEATTQTIQTIATIKCNWHNNDGEYMSFSSSCCFIFLSLSPLHPLERLVLPLRQAPRKQEVSIKCNFSSLTHKLGGVRHRNEEEKNIYIKQKKRNEKKGKYKTYTVAHHCSWTQINYYEYNNSMCVLVIDAHFFCLLLLPSPHVWFQVTDTSKRILHLHY